MRFMSEEKLCIVQTLEALSSQTTYFQAGFLPNHHILKAYMIGCFSTAACLLFFREINLDDLQ